MKDIENVFLKSFSINNETKIIAKRKIRLLNLDAIEMVRHIGSMKINRSLYR